MANELKEVDGASTTTVISHAAALSNNSYTYTGLSGLTETLFDNSSERYPWARAVLSVPDTFAAAPTSGGGVNLYYTPEDIDSTQDQAPAPDATALKTAKWVGFFPIPAYDVATYVEIIIPIKGFIKGRFQIENKTGQALSYSSNPITVKITPFTVKPA